VTKPLKGRNVRLVGRIPALALALSLSLAAAAPASAVTRDEAMNKAVAALGAGQAAGPVVVFTLRAPLPAGSRITQGRTKRVVLAAGRERAWFFYQDLAPSQPYPHRGRVVLVGVRSGKVRVSRTIMRAPRVNGRLPAFLRVFELSGGKPSAPAAGDAPTDGAAPASPVPDGGASTDGAAPAALLGGDPFEPFKEGPNSPPTAYGQDLVVKQNTPKRITLTATDPDEDPLTFQVVERPRRGKLTGQPPDLVYTPGADYVGPDQLVFKARDDDKDSEYARVTLNVVPQGEPPTITASPGCTTYAEHGKGVPIDREMVVSDPDDKELDRATVRIADGFQAGDDLLFRDQNGIVSSYDADAGVLSLTGTASVEAYLSALRSVEYSNPASGNLSKLKYLQFTVNDAGRDSEPALKRICVTADNDPPIGENGEGPLMYIENDGPVPLDGGFVVGDPDSASLSGATIEFVPHVSQPVDANGNPLGPPIVTHSFDPAQDELAFRDQNGITGSYDDASGLLKLSGVASLAAYEAAIRSVTYENTSEDPSEATRRIEFQVTDSGGASSTPVRRDVYITAVNDAPLVRPSKGWTFFTGKPTPIDLELAVFDLDDDLEAAWVRITDGFVSGDVLEYTEQLGISGEYDRESGVLTMKGRAPAADYEAALRSVAYAFPDGTPTGSRTIEFVAYDGELESAAATKVVVTDGRPVLRTTEKPLVYTAGDGWVPVDDAITATDPDSEYLLGATVAIERGFSEAEDELLFKEQNGIVGEYDDGVGVLTLKGEATVADYEAALRSVMYENASEDPTPDRTVSFQVGDGANLSDPVYRDIELTPRR
jgi:Big-like domain-containing protein